ncbi:mid1-interacting protein 1-B [Gouania willdenowi]|uniref:mid1-interacting protein 1-B n=1 Tax=Gouania willdenowi TaxID=441366 RepID=UPI0010555449|nr:mid1-interacting protein 1 [Gouania willdenowi]XP_028291907.1 mid1-interacting protein 1 [Gouania willdenowi]
MMMMQLEEAPIQKNNLFNYMNRFIGAVNNMDQTIMVPSLLRDVPLDEETEFSLKSDMDDGTCTATTKPAQSIRSDIEWGFSCAAADERHKESMRITRTNSSASNDSSLSSSASSSSSSSSSAASSYDGDDDADEDLEKQLQFHLTGLQCVLSKLTQQANCLTKRYKKELGIGGWGQ